MGIQVSSFAATRPAKLPS